MTKRNLHSFIAGLSFTLLGSLASHAAVEGEGETEQQFRFEWKIINGQLLRLDKKTGQFKVVDTGTEDGPAVKADSSKSKAGSGQEGVEKVRDSHKPKRNRVPLIELPGDPEDMRVDIGAEADYVPHEITDSHRRRAVRDVESYKNEIGIVAPLLVSGDNISGTINVENKGKRKLLALELTIFAPIGEAKPFEHHVLFSFQDGREPPPAPNLGPAQRGRAVNSTINAPVPGVVKGKVEVKVTYLKFDE